jgi:hypothetical protein
MKKTPRGSSDDGNLSSFEGKHPTSMFNKTFVINTDSIGHVAKDSGDTVVVFSEADRAKRYDIPKSEIVSLGSQITLRNPENLIQYERDRDSPLPNDKTRLRASTEEIRSAARQQATYEEEERKTRADAVIGEQEELSRYPRHSTTTVATITESDYGDQQESEIVKKLKKAALEFKELFIAGTQVAKKKAKQKKEEVDRKRAEMDAEKISSMGDLALQFMEDFDRIMEEIRTRPYSSQRKIYDGLLTLMEYQQELVVARRDLAARIEPSVKKPVVRRGEKASGKKIRNVKRGTKAKQDNSTTSEIEA